MDAGLDAGRSDAGRDAGPMCAPACGATETCCGAEPDPICVNVRTDPRHCGLCQIDCLSSHRGDGCSASQCTCGTTLLGCTGNRQSWCCPPRAEGTEAYCADLDKSPADCGACNAGCDPRAADRCEGGQCICGTGRAQCEGTPESTCCIAGADVACVDTTSNVLHCGACNRICSTPERCEDGTCTIGEACPGGCDLLEVCCDGVCCTEQRCDEGSC